MRRTQSRLRPRARWLGWLAVFVLVGGLVPPMVEAQEVPPLAPTLEQQLLTKASPDECFDPNAEDPADAYVPMEEGTCPEGTIPKTNQAYVWGLTRAGNGLWFGTAPNYLCMVIGDIAGFAPFIIQEPIRTTSVVCEWGNGGYFQTEGMEHQLDPPSGDWRPPHIYRYDTLTGALVDKTPTEGPPAELINVTEGLRAAGSVGDIAFLAGPVVTQPDQLDKNGVYGGINVFAFRESTGDLVWAENFPQYDNVRQFITVGSSLYMGVMRSEQYSVTQTAFAPSYSGEILRWLPGDGPLTFETVGVLPYGAGGPAEMTWSPVTGRIYVTTWNFATATSGVYMSPTSHPAHVPFTGVDAEEPYVELWTPVGYEPDQMLENAYLGGAIAAYGDYVYWGTMHLPMTGLLMSMMPRAALAKDDLTDSAELVAAAVGTHRATTLWRMNVRTEEIELLYGETELPAFDYETETWQMEETGYIPKWGHSGFGNPFNTYTWAMEVMQGKLFVGTFDWSYLLYGAARDLLPAPTPNASAKTTEPTALGLTPEQFETYYDEILERVSELGEDYEGFGADLARFDGTEVPAVFEDISGVGNFLNYGVRTMETSASGTDLYVGSANPMNLNPEGGWELIRLRGPSTPGPFTPVTPEEPEPEELAACNPAPEDGFVDVPEANVHEANIDCLFALGITDGAPHGRPADEYGPELSVTRAQMASFIARTIEATGALLPEAPANAFVDDEGSTHEVHINQLAAIGVVEGTTATTFEPEASVTRAQMASFLTRAWASITGDELAAGPDAFDDDTGNVHEGAINALAEAGILKGTGERTYAPADHVRRDQMATFLTNLLRALPEGTMA